MNEDMTELKKRFLQSHWPKCNEIANEIVEHGGDEAKEALIAGLNVRRHQVRTAAIKGLASLGDPSVVEVIEKHLTDPAYETRVVAKEAIDQLILE